MCSEEAERPQGAAARTNTTIDRHAQPYQNMTAYSEHTFQPFSIFDRNRVARRNWLHLLGTVSSTVEFHKLQCLVDSPVATVDEASCFVDLSVMSISV